MKFFEKSHEKFHHLQQMVTVMSDAEYFRFESAVFKLLQNPSVFSEVELRNLIAKAGLTKIMLTTVEAF